MSSSFFMTVLQTLGRALIAAGPLSFFAKLRTGAAGEITRRRIWLFALGVSWLAGLLLFLGLMILGHVTSYLGIWSFLWAPVRAQEPPLWVFWLGDARPMGLLFCALIGLLPALVTRRSGWAWVLAAIGLFPGVFSIAGAWSLIVGERLAIWIRDLFAEKEPSLRKDVCVRTGIAIAFCGLLILGGAALRDWVQFNFPAGMQDPEWRLANAAGGLALWTAAETVISLAVFHFYFIFVKNSAHRRR